MTVPLTLSPTGRYLVLTAAFLGWMFSGVQMSVMYLAGRSATIEFLRQGRLDPARPWRFENLAATTPASRSEADLAAPSSDAEKKVLSQIAPKWQAWYNAIFLLGGATGGLLFGAIGDWTGRVRAMALSILAFSLCGGLSGLAVSPEQLLLLRFLTGMGVGGMWPTGVSLASEAWSEVSKPMLAGLIGTAANVGIVMLNTFGYHFPVTPDTWRDLLLCTGVTALLSLFVFFLVPESPKWLDDRRLSRTGDRQPRPGVFRPPLLGRTILGILLGTIPLLGGWGSTGWMIFWSEKAVPGDPSIKALTGILRGGGACIGALLGGYIANLLGRRTTYFLISLFSLCLCEAIYLGLVPQHPLFNVGVFTVGFISTIFFGWLPLYLPELFPTHARATGSGVSFNFGRILTAIGVIGQGSLVAFYKEDYAAAGSVVSLVYAVGMIVILFAPDTTKKVE